MKLLNLNKVYFLSVILFIFFTPLLSEDSVDIWKKENLKINKELDKSKNITSKQPSSKIKIKSKIKEEININSSVLDSSNNFVYGIFDPEENNLTIDMWVNSEGTRVKDTIERINKIKLSSFSEKIFINTLFTIAKLPAQNMTEEEFLDYKFDWLIKNNKDDLIAAFLNRNNEFPSKKKSLNIWSMKTLQKLI